MSGTWHWYGLGMKSVATGVIDMDTDTFYIMLASSAYTPNQDTDQYRSTVTANEVSGTGYTAGGETLGAVTASYDAASNEVRFAWSSPSWPGASITARTAVIYKHRGGADTADDLVAYCTEAADVTSSGGTFSVTLPSPTLKITVS